MAWKGRLLNGALVILGLLVVLLVYSLVSRVLSPAETALREGASAELVGDIIQVEVRNGCGISGLAGDVTRYLRKSGFDVVEVGDHASFDVAHSMVIDRVGNLQTAKKVAASLGIPEERVIQDVQLDLYLDSSVIIGMDYETLKPFVED